MSQITIQPPIIIARAKDTSNVWPRILSTLFLLMSTTSTRIDAQWATRPLAIDRL
jgi:hypothetical protein